MTVIMLLLVFLFSLPMRAMAAPETAEQDGAVATSTDVVSGGDGQFVTNPNFHRVSMVPLNVEIPYFYSEVVTISGMYIFTMPDGVVYKRIYGSLDGKFGWYEPKGVSNDVPDGSPLIDTEDDVEMYETALRLAGVKNEDEQSYYGLLPPENGSPSLASVFGWSPSFVYVVCAMAAAALCLIILISSKAAKRPEKK